jgi:hypothetical protein
VCVSVCVSVCARAQVKTINAPAKMIYNDSVIAMLTCFKNIPVRIFKGLVILQRCIRAMYFPVLLGAQSVVICLITFSRSEPHSKSVANRKGMTTQ